MKTITCDICGAPAEENTGVYNWKDLCGNCLIEVIKTTIRIQPMNVKIKLCKQAIQYILKDDMRLTVNDIKDKLKARQRGLKDEN